MPWCYCNSGGYGRFMERREQPLAESPDPADRQAEGSQPANRAVECVEDGLWFASTAEAGKAMDGSGAARKIRAACFDPEKVAFGRHWRWSDQEGPDGRG